MHHYRSIPSEIFRVFGQDFNKLSDAVSMLSMDSWRPCRSELCLRPRVAPARCNPSFRLHARFRSEATRWLLFRTCAMYASKHKQTHATLIMQNYCVYMYFSHIAQPMARCQFSGFGFFCPFLFPQSLFAVRHDHRFHCQHPLGAFASA